MNRVSPCTSQPNDFASQVEPRGCVTVAAAQNPPSAPPGPDAQKCVALTELNLEAAPGGPAIITSAHLVEVPVSGLDPHPGGVLLPCSVLFSTAVHRSPRPATVERILAVERDRNLPGVQSGKACCDRTRGSRSNCSGVQEPQRTSTTMTSAPQSRRFSSIVQPAVVQNHRF